jgi:streptogramin lyase
MKKYKASSIDKPGGIVAGPDGALWFVNDGNGSIGRITTAGKVTKYTFTGMDASCGLGAQCITAGPDGALWFCNGDSIGRITTAGKVTTFALTTMDCTAITSGPNGALWFTSDETNGEFQQAIGSITTSGVVREYLIDGEVNADGITTGSDGALWIAEQFGSILRITTAGVMTSYTAPGSSEDFSIAAGADGAIWVTNYTGSAIDRITVVPAVALSLSSGVPGTSVSASGYGYAPGETVDVTYATGLKGPANATVCTATATSDGKFSCSGDLPTGSSTGAKGSHKISAEGETSFAFASAFFTLT